MYERQEGLPLKIPDAVAVVGVGGAGSWAALFLALVGVKRIILVDPDVVEESNLNRMPVPASDVGEYKVYSVATLLKRVRPDAEVIPVPLPVEEAVQLLEEYGPVVIDARDRVEPLPPPVAERVRVEIRYDGMHITANTRTGRRILLGDATGGYSVASWVGGAAMAGLLALYAVTVDDDVWGDAVFSFDVRELPSLLGLPRLAAAAGGV